jgi:hypothetical protein
MASSVLLLYYALLLAASTLAMLAITFDQPVTRVLVMLHGKKPCKTGGNAAGPLPDYADIVKYEARLPQHMLELPFPEGRKGRYVKFTNQPERVGWNNVLNEMYVSPPLPFLNSYFLFISFLFYFIFLSFFLFLI